MILRKNDPYDEEEVEAMRRLVRKIAGAICEQIAERLEERAVKVEAGPALYHGAQVRLPIIAETLREAAKVVRLDYKSKGLATKMFDEYVADALVLEDA